MLKSLANWVNSLTLSKFDTINCPNFDLKNIKMFSSTGVTEKEVNQPVDTKSLCLIKKIKNNQESIVGFPVTNSNVWAKR